MRIPPPRRNSYKRPDLHPERRRRRSDANSGCGRPRKDLRPPHPPPVQSGCWHFFTELGISIGNAIIAILAFITSVVYGTFSLVLAHRTIRLTRETNCHQWPNTDVS
jgi:hypothetical protein